MQVVCGELGESVLEQLSALSQDVVLPLLSNPANHVGISEGVGREVQARLHQFIADGMHKPHVQSNLVVRTLLIGTPGCQRPNLWGHLPICQYIAVPG